MSTSATLELPIEKRVAQLEEQMAVILNTTFSKDPVPSSAWQSTVGKWVDDRISREADQLGAEWRQQCDM